MVIYSPTCAVNGDTYSEAIASSPKSHKNKLQAIWKLGCFMEMNKPEFRGISI